MKGKVGIPTTGYELVVPHSIRFSKIASLSREAKTRLKWMDFYRKHKNARKTCRHFGISHSTFYKWLTRYREQGLTGLEDQSKRPNRVRTSRIPYEVIDRVVTLRQEYPAWSKYKLSVILKRDHEIELSASSVGRILKKKGLIEIRKTNTWKKAAKRRVKRQKAERYLKELCPGSLVYIDTKHICFPGKKFYQFTAIDSKTRIKFIRVFASASSGCGKMFFDEMKEVMPFPVNAVQTDNGGEYLAKFDTAVRQADIPHYFSDPNCPKQNGRVERVIKTSTEEFWDYNMAYTVEEMNGLADRWTHIYNHIRPHQTLDYLTPVEYLAKLTENGILKTQEVSTMY